MLTLTKYRSLFAPETYDRVYDGRQATRQLPLDVRLEDDTFVVTAGVPGLKAEDLKLEILDDTVTLRAEVPVPTTTENTTWLLQERHYGQFARTLTFPVALDGAHAEASVENGVLTLRVPKAEAAKAKVIPVKTK